MGRAPGRAVCTEVEHGRTWSRMSESLAMRAPPAGALEGGGRRYCDGCGSAVGDGGDLPFGLEEMELRGG